MGQQALLLYVSCSALLVAPVPALLRGPKPTLMLGFSLVVIVTNKRKIPEAEISTMLANYIYF